MFSIFKFTLLSFSAESQWSTRFVICFEGKISETWTFFWYFQSSWVMIFYRVLDVAIQEKKAFYSNLTRTREYEEPLSNKYWWEVMWTYRWSPKNYPWLRSRTFFPAEMTRSIKSRSNIYTDIKIKSENLRIVSTVVSIEGIFQWHFQCFATVNIVSDRKLLNGCPPGRLQWNEWHSSA